MISLDVPAQLDHDQRYDVLVSAHSRNAAVEIAAEALPEGASVVYVAAENVALREGRDSWQVAIWFARKTLTERR